MPSNFDVFISYSRANSDFAKPFYDALKSAGLEVWMDRSNIPNTSKWRKEIQKGIYSSQLVIILVSQASMTSDNVDQEIDFAVDQAKPLLQIDIEPLEAGTFRHLALTGLHRLSVSDFSQTFDFTDLVNQVKNSVPALKAEAPDKIVSSTSEEKSQVQAEQIASKSPRSPSTKEKPLSKANSAQPSREKSQPSKPIPVAVNDTNVSDEGGWTKLHRAIRENQLEEVISLVERGTDINAQGDSGRTPLHLAVEQVALVRWLLLQGADYKAKTVDGSTPLDFARNAKSTQTVHLLQTWAAVKEGYTTANKALRAALDLPTYKAKRIFDAVAAGADDMTMRDGRGLTALHWAAQENHLNIVLLLLERGADTKAKDNQGNTPLDLAKEKGATKVIDQLSTSAKVATPKEKSPIPESQKVPLSNSDANAQLQSALSLGQGRFKDGFKSEQILRAIRGGVTDFSLTDKTGHTALHWAAMRDDVQAAQIALEGGADANAISNLKQTPLDLAKASNATKVVALLSAPAKTVAPSTEAEEPMQSNTTVASHSAAKANSPAAVGKAHSQTIPMSKGPRESKDVVDAKVIVPPNTASSQMANKDLVDALNSPSPQKAKLIFQAVSQGANKLGAADKLGRTALHWAALKGNSAMVKFILEHGGDVDAKTTQYEETALHLAAKKNFSEVAAELITFGASLEAQSLKQCLGNTPLMVAADHGAMEVVRLLIEAGAKLNTRGTWSRYTALHRAAQGNQAEVAKVLIESGADINAKACRDCDYETPLDVAKEYKSFDVVHLLMQAGAK